ncbi:MAG: class I tRNA ligase family protein, partial [Syntrophomonadaceae bacterium]|nr:class I tRNA ligase family protein [Syntrophomonadaceae bacterium]
RLSGRSLEDMMAGARVEVDERKENPMDFALWKQAKPGEPSWPSPWGPGRPGWHIECSVMSMKYLGPTLDVHGGGVDLVFPHHENEIAQSEAYTGQRFVNYWIHNGFITVNQEKMSKSLGNFFIVREVLSKFPADVVRFYLAATHYRSPLDFDDAKLEEAGRALERVKNALRRLDEALQAGGAAQAVESGLAAEALQARVSALVNEFEEAMDDDFNTSRAMAAVFELAREVNSFLDGRGHLSLSEKERAAAAGARRAMRTLAGDILGLFGARGAEVADTQKALVDAAVALRKQARASRQFAVADRIRAFLGEQGIVVEDTPAGARLSFSRSPDTEALARFLVSEWAEARRRGEESQAEAVRQALAGAGITVEEQEEGVRWRVDAAGKN